ncbi:MAG: TraB/GumN family protein [Desulfovibrio sp.]|nr:TraB/GumN family protein [Desulfovibrio sp.]
MPEALASAVVPEHSVAFMRAMSGGVAFYEGEFIFLHAEDWLMGIGYPLREAALFELADANSPAALDNALSFEAALKAVLGRTKARSCWAIAPLLPERLEPFTECRDQYYLLNRDSSVPKNLRRPLESVARRLSITEDRLFTPAHRRLWAEFLGRAPMRPNVRELYARTEAVLAVSRASMAKEGAARNETFLDLRLLNAWHEDGSLAASLLLDYSPPAFCAYMIGAHSKERYSPHATDLLFAEMLVRARRENKRFIHLGLGVNEGITRFKRKWGGRAALPYVMASWTEDGGAGYGQRRGSDAIGAAARAILAMPADMSKQQIFDGFAQQRTFAMIFEVAGQGAVSYLCGSAHFFRYSFEFSFRELFEPLHTVVFEGPLDEAFLAAVESSGRSPEPGSPRIVDLLTERDIARLERAVYGPEGSLLRLLGLSAPRRIDLRDLLSNARPWFAFFSIWVAYLERLGWRESVDLEAWRTAKDMGKAVIAMENIDEQLDSLQSVPIERIADFFRRCRLWPACVKRNVSSYLNGDLGGMMGSSIEFPSRTEMVIDRRDERFRRRMRPFLEAGGCAVFVGTAHLVGLIPMLEADGFAVRQVYPSLRLKLRAAAKRLCAGKKT